MYVYKVLFIGIFLFSTPTRCRADDPKILRLCISQNSCENCLEASPSCAWCSDWSYSNLTVGKPRCNVRKNLLDFGCPLAEIRTAPTGSVKLLEDLEFQDVAENRAPVQLKPQKVKLRIRPNSRTEIQVQFRPAKNYPLDLYYLMDLTWSMKDDKETLVGLGQKMTDTLGTFTPNFRLGFGSYADKPLMPYIFPGHEADPCRSEHTTCAPLYSFQHHLTLTSDVEQFIGKVNHSSITGNVDNLEGGLDGVVQATVCKNQVGWMRQARKLMLVATDGYLHFAGEGKLGGVVERQDFECHLDENGEYSLANKYDYPSLGEVSRLLHEHKVNVIFAVTEDKRDEYEYISDLLKEKARVATLTGNSSNILEIINTAYHEIVTRVVLRDNSTSPLRLEYFSNCGKGNDTKLNTSECDGVEDGRVYDFRVVFSFDKCPRNESLWKQTVVIDDALASETSEVLVEVELLCGCDCEDAESSHCEHGSNKCGVCECDLGWSGEHCDCDESSIEDNRLQCIASDSTTICSDRGDCICGSCSCEDGFKGQFCECPPCDKIGGVECGDRGTCDCGVCKCLDGWKGNACQCPSGNERCMAPGSDEICAGHGYCDCGECRCNTTASDGLLYRGTYCESSASAGGSGLCVLYDSCVNATVEDPENVKEFCQTNITLYETQKVGAISADTNGSEHLCLIRRIRDSTTCTVPYIYEFQKDNTVILKIGEKTCRTPMHAAIVPGIIFIVVLFTGIVLLLIWKCWTSIQDKREFAKFELERKKTVYALEQNPLYRPATTQFIVPASFQFKED